MMEFKGLGFQPLPGLSSNHLQMVVAALLSPGREPPSKKWLVDIGNGDSLCCEVSTPARWKAEDQTVVLIHGLGGCHTSNYMIRMARKLYGKGHQVVRVNLRGCGSGKGLSKLLYHGGTSADVFAVIQALKKSAPASQIVVIGFSLGGNIALKLAGELGEKAAHWVRRFVAVCSPLDLGVSARTIQEKQNRLYHFYYLKKMKEQAPLELVKKIENLSQFDDAITAPPWGYKNAEAYYRDCSSIHFLPRIEQSTCILLAKDDPFIPLDRLAQVRVGKAVQIYVTEKGGHMGFLGKTNQRGSFFWMDELLLHWSEVNNGD